MDHNNKTCRKCIEERKPKPKDVCLPIDGFSGKFIDKKGRLKIMIIAEAHGGGNREKWKSKNRKNLMKNYYLSDENIQKFHQFETRKLLEHLEKKEVSWFFTDLIKCYVDHEEMSIAQKHCFKHLKKQIFILNPEKIILLGYRVQNAFLKEFVKEDEREKLNPIKFKKNGEKKGEISSKEKEIHGRSYPIEINEGRKKIHTEIVFSIFPSQWTADIWVSSGDWKKIKERI